tara:strand:+ start:4532 stop:5383 length:852 start_codon:yes stop_codon:yes gene_type:complete
MNIEQYMYYLLYALVYLVLATAMKYILNIRSSKHYQADDVIADGNIAVGLRRSGAQLGLAIAMLGVMSGASNPDIMQDIIDTFTYGLVAIGFMVTSLLFTDRALLPNVNNTEELKRGNVAIGVVEFGALVMTGILAYASIKGDDGGILSSLVYFVVGQVTMVILVLFYEKVLARKINPVARVLEGNLSAGVYLSGKIIAYGLILQSAIVGNGHTSFTSDAVIEYIVAAFVGMILLYVFELLIDLLIVTSTKVSDIIIKDQLVAAIQLSITKIGMALLLGVAIL